MQLCLLMFYSCLIGQDHASMIDSLKNQAMMNQSKDEKLDSYLLITFEYRRTSLDSMEKYLNKVFELVDQSVGTPVSLSKAYNLKGIFKAKKNYPADSIAADYVKALAYTKESGVIERQLSSFNNIGVVYQNDGQFYKALEHFYDGLEVAETHQINSHPSRGLLLGNIGSVYQEFGDIKKANNYYSQALSFADEIGSDYLKSTYGDNYIATLYPTGNYDKMIQQSLELIELQKKLKDNESLIDSYNNLAKAHIELGEFERTQKYLEAAENLINEGQLENFRNTVNVTKIRLFQLQNRIDEAIELGLTTYSFALEKDHFNKLLACVTLLIELFEEKGDKEKSNFYRTEFIRLSKEKNASNHLILLDNYEKNYAKSLESKLEASEMKRNFNRIILWVLFLTSLIIGYYATRNRRLYKSSEIAKENLSKSNQELQQYIESNKELENFAHIAAHDIKAPLHTISSFIGLLKKKSSIAYNEKDKEYFHFIETAASQLSKLVNDLLSFSKIDTEKNNFEKLDTQYLIENVLKKLKVVMQEKSVVIESKNIPESIIGDRLKLDRVFQNLLTNAIKFCPKDRIPSITIEGSTTPEAYIFKIKDNGIGIPEEDINQIFMPFKRLHSADQFKGTGLGLSIVKKLIQQHKGDIQIESKLNEGTTFSFSILKNLN